MKCSVGLAGQLEEDDKYFHILSILLLPLSPFPTIVFSSLLQPVSQPASDDIFNDQDKNSSVKLKTRKRGPMFYHVLQAQSELQQGRRDYSFRFLWFDQEQFEAKFVITQHNKRLYSNFGGTRGPIMYSCML